MVVLVNWSVKILFTIFFSLVVDLTANPFDFLTTVAVVLFIRLL